MIFSALFGSAEANPDKWPPSPDNPFWYSDVDGGGGSAAGMLVTRDTALRVGTVHACVRVLAETVAQLPLIIYRRRGDGGKDRATDHPLWGLLHDTPNGWQTSFQWREQGQAHLGLAGNAYSRIVERGRTGRIVGLEPIEPERVDVEQLPDRTLRYRVHPEGGGATERLVQGEVLHIPALSWDGICGRNPIAALRESAGIALAAQDYTARFYRNDARPRGIIKHPAHFKDGEAADRFAAQFKRQQTGANRHNTLILEDGMEYVPVGMSNADAQFIENRRYQDVDIARIYRVPPHMVGILDRATFSNIEQQAIEFVVHTMMPWLRRWEQAITRQLIGDDRFFAEFNVTGLLRGDTKNRYAAYQSGINAGWLTRNEVRRLENLNPLDGLDEPLEPLNMAPAGEDRDDDSAAAGDDNRDRDNEGSNA